MKRSIRSIASLLFFASLYFIPLSSLSAVVLEDFSSTNTVVLVADTGSSIGASVVGGQTGNAVQISYALGTGNYVVLSKDYTSRDFSTAGGNAVRFRYKFSGNPNTFETKFTDTDSTTTTSAADKLSFKFIPQADSQWKVLTLAFSTFTLFGDGNSSFDLTRVSHMSFGLTADNTTRGSGSLVLDKIELYKSTETLIDDFQDGAEPNFFGGTNLNNFETGGTAVPTYVTLGSDRVLQMTYNVTAGSSFSGIFLNLKKNFQGYTHLSFRVRGNAGGEIVKAKLESVAGNNEVFISTYLTGGITTSFQRVNIPVSAFPLVNFSTINVLTFLLENSIGSGSGTVWFDDIGFIRLGETPGVVAVLDDLDSDFGPSNWDRYTHADATLNVLVAGDSSPPGSSANNRVYQLDYNFTTSPTLPGETPYAVIDRPFQLSIAPFSVLRFKYRGTESSNNVELKFIDSDNTVWIKKFLLASNTLSAWKTSAIPLTELSLFSAGTDTSLNMRNIKKVEIAVARGSGGNGTLVLDQLESSESGEFQVENPGRLISSFRIVNNPFSPNGDGVKDEAFFVYTIASASKVTLSIYNMQGDRVKQVLHSEQVAGEQAAAWNGRDENGDKVANGLYIYRLEAEGADHRNDVLRQVVGVLR